MSLKIRDFLLNINRIAIYSVIISLSLVLLRYASWCGVIFTDDSYNYVHAAASLLESGHLISPDQTPFSAWPPLFSTIISIFLSLNIIRLEILQYIVFLINGVLLVMLAERFLQEQIARYLFLVFVLFSVSSLMIHVFLWSEAFFLSIVLYLILKVLHFLKDPSWKNVYILIILLNLLCLQRNAGIFILMGVGSYLLFFTRIDKIKITLMLGGGAIAFFTWNVYSSYFYSDGFDFLDHSYFSGFFRNTSDLLNVVSAWFLPRFLPPLMRILLPALLIIILAAKGLFRNIQLGEKYKLLMTIILVYGAAHTSIGSLDFYEIERYLSVLFPIVVVLVIYYLYNVRMSKYSKMIFLLIL